MDADQNPLPNATTSLALQTAAAAAANQIQHEKTFCKLFGVSRPVPGRLAHYAAALVQSAEYAWLLPRMRQWAEFERSVGGETKPVVEAARSKLVERLEGSAAVQAMRSPDWAAPMLNGQKRQEDLLHPQHLGKWVVELDQVSANYNALRERDLALPDWPKLVEECGGPAVLGESKSLRQEVVGTVENRRLQAVEWHFTLTTKEFLRSALLLQDGDEVVRANPDELAIACPKEADLGYATQLAHLIRSAVADPTITRRRHMRWRVEVWRLQPLGYAPGYLQEVHPLDGQPYRSLFAVPGNRFYHAFKRSVLGQPVQPEDLEFALDGGIARWI